jgi:hypothetical protein
MKLIKIVTFFLLASGIAFAQDAGEGKGLSKPP